MDFSKLTRWGRTISALVFLYGLIAVVPVSAHADASPAEADKFDLLIYKDGDRVKGRLKERSPTEIIFLSQKFGLLHVKVADAKVLLANGEEDTVAEARARTEEAEGPFNLWSLLSMRSLTAQVRNFFGPWHGRFAVSAQVVDDTTERTNYMTEAHLQRKWK